LVIPSRIFAYDAEILALPNQSIWLSGELYELTHEECKGRSCNLSELVGEALKLYFDKKERAKDRMVLKVKDPA